MSEPVTCGADTSWGSHLVPLMACVCATRGAVLEIGAGHWSTPMLHRYCTAGGRRLVTLDNDRKWIEQFADMRVCEHELHGCKYDDVLPALAKQQWSVVFLDQSPGGRRAADAMLFRDSADYILSHDYSGAEVYEPFAAVLDNWLYGAVARFSPSTLVLGRVPLPQFDKCEDFGPVVCENCRQRPSATEVKFGSIGRVLRVCAECAAS